MLYETTKNGVAIGFRNLCIFTMIT